jgi:metallophosphoesterase (TIGR00282 family)
MRLLFLGDVVARAGREAVRARLPGLISDFKLDFVIVNGENAAGGFGISESIYFEFLEGGANVVTTGNHVWAQKHALAFCERHEGFLRPANYPAGTPGRGFGVYTARNGARVMVANIMGQVFMQPSLENPFVCADMILDENRLRQNVEVVVFDFHAEATSEKQCFGHYVDGRASVVIGTHTHIPTSDAQILNAGTAYMTDAGMCGDYDSSLGMDKEEPLSRFVSNMRTGKYHPASGPATICGVGVDLCDTTGLALAVEPLRLGPRLAENIPGFWI